MTRFHLRNLWIALGGLALLCRHLASPDVIESWYARGLFPLIRRGFDLLTGWLPFAAVYLLAGGMLLWLFFFLKNFSLAKWSDWRQWLRAAHGVLAFCGAVVFLFLLLWGFNYDRVPLEEQVGLSPVPLGLDELRREMELATTEAVAARRALDVPEGEVVCSPIPVRNWEPRLRAGLKELLAEWGYPVSGCVRTRMLFPRGLLLRISTAGVYIPFVGEGHVDPGLHDLQLPFVMVHEMGHGYGFGGEGTCNFLAWLTCRRSTDPFLRYVGALYYWRYVAADYHLADPLCFEELAAALPEGIHRDLEAIRQAIDRYPDILPAVRDAAYTAYLHAQGISDGLKNYDRVIMLVHAWRKQSGEDR
ncbi:MAG: hypothetical protein KatS3mg029_0809 [Saprospiraceae bacterium]|nr:MAG: hypothetical protein KatS3mg029_0809 [Saprospiraceae bacterium]